MTVSRSRRLWLAAPPAVVALALASPILVLARMAPGGGDAGQASPASGLFEPLPFTLVQGDAVAEEGPPIAPVESAVTSGQTQAVTAAPVETPSFTAPTPEYLRRLEAAGMTATGSGDRTRIEAYGTGTPAQLRLAQEAAERFGIMRNPFFDPLRVAAIRDGRALVDLTTGVITGHGLGSAMFGTTEVIPADQLQELRNAVGFSLSAIREAEAARYERILGFVPAYLQSDEAFAVYKERARTNYVSLAARS